MASESNLRAATVWRARLDFELQAAARFASIERLLRRAGAPELLVEMAGRASDDEVRHARLCGELTEHFGGVAPTVAMPPAAAPLDPRGAIDVQLVHELVAMSCITESLSTALLLELVERATDGRAKDAMRSIVRDEVRHARLGWAYLSYVPRSAAHDVIAARLPYFLEGAVTAGLFTDEEESADVRALTGVGQLPRARRRDLVIDTLDQVVFPGLERFGIDAGTGRAWTERMMLGTPRPRRRPRRSPRLASA